MRRFFGYLSSLEFFLKVALTCVLVQQLIYLLVGGAQLSFGVQVLLYWFVGSASFYGLGFFIEEILKKNERIRRQLGVRQVKVKPQPYPRFTLKGIVLGELRALVAAVVILTVAPEVHRGNGLVLNCGWFFMNIVVADFLFYVMHRILHRKSLYWIHRKHHEFRDTSAWVAGHKSGFEYVFVTLTDILPILIFGYDITQLYAWTIVGVAYNLEGHSALSLFFISSNFHDLHHTAFQRNYGIQDFWDRVFGTLNPTTHRRGLMSPIASLAATKRAETESTAVHE